MTSQVRIDIPAPPLASTADVRANFAVIKQELEALQSWRDSLIAADSPLFTGTTSLVNANVSGALTPQGTLDFGQSTPVYPAVPASVITAGMSFGANCTARRIGKMSVEGLCVLEIDVSCVSGTPASLFAIALGLRPFNRTYFNLVKLNGATYTAIMADIDPTTGLISVSAALAVGDTVRGSIAYIAAGG